MYSAIKKTEHQRSQRRAEESRPKSVKGNPYGGMPLHLPPELVMRIRESFGIEPDRLKLRESEEVAEMGARATAQGDAIRFAPGEFQPGSAEGLAVLGHELEHVRQQAEGSAVAGGRVLRDPASEARSDSAGTAFASGRLSAPGPVPSMTGAVSAPVQMLEEEEEEEEDDEEEPPGVDLDTSTGSEILVTIDNRSRPEERDEAKRAELNDEFQANYENTPLTYKNLKKYGDPHELGSWYGEGKDELRDIHFARRILKRVKKGDVKRASPNANLNRLYAMARATQGKNSAMSQFIIDAIRSGNVKRMSEEKFKKRSKKKTLRRLRMLKLKKILTLGIGSSRLTNAIFPARYGGDQTLDFTEKRDPSYILNYDSYHGLKVQRDKDLKEAGDDPEKIEKVIADYKQAKEEKRTSTEEKDLRSEKRRAYQTSARSSVKRFAGLAKFAEFKPGIRRRLKEIKKSMSKEEFKIYWREVNDPHNSPFPQDSAPEDLVDDTKIRQYYPGFLDGDRKTKRRAKRMAKKAGLPTDPNAPGYIPDAPDLPELLGDQEDLPEEEFLL